MEKLRYELHESESKAIGDILHDRDIVILFVSVLFYIFCKIRSIFYYVCLCGFNGFKKKIPQRTKPLKKQKLQKTIGMFSCIYK